MSVATVQAALADRDPETLIGPLLFLFTRFACHGTGDARRALADHLAALALHPGVDITLRLAAGALAVEHQWQDASDART